MVAMGARVLTVSREVDAALDVAAEAAGVLAGEVDSLAAPQLAVMVPEVAKVIARFEAVRLAAVRAADRADVAARAGMASTAEWIAGVTGEKRGKARGDVELAGKLAEMGEIADALASGEVSKTQADTLSGAAGATTAEQRQLLGDAKAMSVNELQRRVERFNRDRRQPPPPVTPTVIVNPGPGASVRAEVTLDALGGEYFTTAMDAAHSQMSFAKATSLAERRGRRAGRHLPVLPGDHTTLHHRLGRPHAIVTIPLSTLRDESGEETATLASGAVIDAATARQTGLRCGRLREPSPDRSASRSTSAGRPARSPRRSPAN